MACSDFYDALGPGPLLAAHRGWREIRPENTMPAFEAAVGRCDFIELDVQLSRDDVWFVCHDPTLERTTDVETRYPGKLRPRRLCDHTHDTLRELDAGSWFLERDPFGALASGFVKREEIEALLPVRMPTLQEVLAFACGRRVPLNVEIKDMPRRNEEEVTKRFLDALEPFAESLPPLLVSSFNHRVLQLLRRGDPGLSLAALAEGCHPPRLLDYLREAGACAYHVDAGLVDSLPVEMLEKEGIACGVYVVNDPKERKSLFEKGIRTVFTDRLPK